jgi:hypothetical protein
MRAPPNVESPAPRDSGNRAQETDRLGNQIEAESRPLSLAAQHRAWGFPTDKELLWLLDQRLPEKALWPIAGATVAFRGKTFDIDPAGVRALIFRATDRGEVIDLVCWQPRSGRIASWCGVAAFLGDQDLLFNPASWFDGGAIKIHADPLA